jgi:uncharacterized protein (TIGR02466 family)
MYKLETIFPTTILFTNIKRSFTEQELSIVEKHKSLIHRNNGNASSLESYILNKELPDIKQYVDLAIQEYVDKILTPKHKIEMYITQSWLNYTNPGEYHHRHNHQNSIISGVVYFNAEESADKIHFYNENNNTIFIPPKNIHLYNAIGWWFPVKTGDIILFPSSLHHMVEHTTSSQTRVSLAFNVFVKGLLGEERNLNELHL